ncbi:MAG: DUF1775 domain-containing protein [Candidatus Saccharibacteria bacterium]
MKKFLTGITTTGAIVLALPAVAFAHVIVTPSQAGVGQELVFNVSVPNERESDVTSVKLNIPKGVGEVTPTVIPAGPSAHQAATILSAPLPGPAIYR